jgi:hypothetical protein
MELACLLLEHAKDSFTGSDDYFKVRNAHVDTYVVLWQRLRVLELRAGAAAAPAAASVAGIGCKAQDFVLWRQLRVLELRLQ